jgi:hypothetical protein
MLVGGHITAHAAGHGRGESFGLNARIMMTLVTHMLALPDPRLDAHDHVNLVVGRGIGTSQTQPLSFGREVCSNRVRPRK